MLTGQAVGAMVPMIAPRAVGNHQVAAYLAGEAVITGVMAIIAFYIFFTLIFSVQVFFLLKVIVFLTLREVLRNLAYANLPA